MSDTRNSIPEHDLDERGLCVLFCPACHLDRETALRIEAAPLIAAAVAALGVELKAAQDEVAEAYEYAAELEIREHQAVAASKDIDARIAAAVTEEREACAKVALDATCAGNNESWWAAQTAIADAIRARGGES